MSEWLAVEAEAEDRERQVILSEVLAGTQPLELLRQGVVLEEQSVTVPVLALEVLAEPHQALLILE